MFLGLRISFFLLRSIIRPSEPKILNLISSSINQLFQYVSGLFITHFPKESLSLFSHYQKKLITKHGSRGSLVRWCLSASGMRNLVFIDGVMNHVLYLNMLKYNLKLSEFRH